MKICIVGNSHAGMLIAAHSKARMQNVDLTVFAKPGLVPEEFAIDGSVLLARDDDLKTRLTSMSVPHELDLSGFGAVIFAGLLPSAFAAMKVSQGKHILGWPSSAEAVEQMCKTPSRPTRHSFLTRAAVRSTLKAVTQTSLTYVIAAALRQVCDVPVFAISQPFASENLLQKPESYRNYCKRVTANDGSALAHDLLHSHRTALSQIPNLTYVPQPPETVSQGCLTHLDFVRGATRLDIDKFQARTDVLHGNAELGLLYWSHILDR